MRLVPDSISELVCCYRSPPRGGEGGLAGPAFSKILRLFLAGLSCGSSSEQRTRAAFSPKSSTRAKETVGLGGGSLDAAAWCMEVASVIKAHACVASRLPRAEQTWDTRVLRG
jgi:hypothetical protein